MLTILCKINTQKVFLFINTYNLNQLSVLNKNIDIIFRNYHNKNNEDILIKIRDYCRKNGRKFYLSNDLKIALKLNLDGIYIPSFNQKINFVKYSIKKNFKIIGSAHNVKEIKNKINQKCSLIFLSPIFKSDKNKKYLDIIKFNLLTLNYNSNFVALGGINQNNLKKINLTKSVGFAGISGIK